MRNYLYQSMMVISLFIIPILFSCATAEKEKTESRDAKFYYNRGCAYSDKGQHDQAILDFTKALEINPRHASAYNNRGIAYGNKSQYDQAISDFTKALEIDSRYSLAYYSRGLAYYFKKQYGKSWDDVKKAQDLGYQIPPKFLDDLRKASGGEK